MVPRDDDRWTQMAPVVVVGKLRLDREIDYLGLLTHLPPLADLDTECLPLLLWPLRTALEVLCGQFPPSKQVGTLWWESSDVGGAASSLDYGERPLISCRDHQVSGVL